MRIQINQVSYLVMQFIKLKMENVFYMVIPKEMMITVMNWKRFILVKIK